jgi:RNA polymerase sigma-70 factor (ECF subfamily)
LDRLGDLDRETLEAFYVRGQSLIEMSDEFSSPIGTIKRRLHVARKRLARELHALAPM